MKGRMALFLGGSLAFWLVLAVPARVLWGLPAVWHSLVAAALCLVPTSLTLLGAPWATRQPPEMQLAVVLGGTLLRIVVVLVGGLVIWFRVPFFQDPAFWGWVLVFYLFTLALETMLVLVRPAPAGNSPR